MSAAILLLFRLYLIEILHQTTTVSAISAFLFGCILLKFYIKPQQSSYCLVSFEVVSYWNSTSNHNSLFRVIALVWVVSYWNSTSNHNNAQSTNRKCHVVSYWNSTSNHNHRVGDPHGRRVVSYWNSTSNHNRFAGWYSVRKVVSYWNSTSNHNRPPRWNIYTLLYLIEILHQTTTAVAEL